MNFWENLPIRWVAHQIGLFLLNWIPCVLYLWHMRTGVDRRFLPVEEGGFGMRAGLSIAAPLCQCLPSPPVPAAVTCVFSPSVSRYGMAERQGREAGVPYWVPSAHYHRPNSSGDYPKHAARPHPLPSNLYHTQTLHSLWFTLQPGETSEALSVGWNLQLL